MKIIVSHDVDHLTVWEHKRDLILPKFIIRTIIEVGLGLISSFEVKDRVRSILQNKWHNLEELMAFDNKNGIPSTFFVGVANGLGLSYSLKNAEMWINRILEKGFDVGVHGIAYDNYDSVKNEHEIFRKVSGLDRFGIRMHYLRRSPDTLKFEEKAGYVFDSTLYEFKDPVKIGNMWEFPLHVMDTYLFYGRKSSWRKPALVEVKDETKRRIEKALRKEISYFTLLFHDRAFYDGFQVWKEWYIWLVGWLKESGFRFINYKEAIQELDSLK